MNDIVLSVPHSGTRTLQNWLKDEQGIVRNTQPDPNEMVGHWHFGMHTYKIEEMLTSGHGNGHVPLRNPVDVSDSWRRRYRTDPDPGKLQHNVHDAIYLMLTYLQEYPNRTQVYKMEDIPDIHGRGPDQDLSREALYHEPRIVELREWFQNEDLVRNFYLCYYTRDELWWM